MIRTEDGDVFIVESKDREDFISEVYTSIDIFLCYPVDDIVGLDNVTAVYLAKETSNGEFIKFAKLNNLQDMEWESYEL